MSRSLVARLSLVLLAATCFGLTTSAPKSLFDAESCEDGCKADAECAENARCVALFNTACGLCLCSVGYKKSGEACVEIDGTSREGRERDRGPGTKPQTEMTSPSEPSDQTPSPASTPAPTNRTDPRDPTPSRPSPANATATPPPAPFDGILVCSDYDCEDALGSNTDDGDPFRIRTSKVVKKGCPKRVLTSEGVRCPKVGGGGIKMCANGGECFDVDAETSNCLCPPHAASRTCHVVKSERNCSQSTGKLPAGGKEVKGKKFVHIRDRQFGAIYGRHVAADLETCIRLCEWAGPTYCRSLNFGMINGKKVCELLTVWAEESSILYNWLEDAPGWTYACCFGKNKARGS